MTRTISLIIGIATAALVVGVPTAFGEGRLAGSVEPAAVAPDWFERAAIRAADGNGGVVVVSRPDSHDVVRSQPNGYLDAADRAQRIDVVVPTALTDSFERSAPPRGSTVGSSGTTSSGTELDWPQLGTGFGFGLALALGLFLAMRYTRGRPLAH